MRLRPFVMLTALAFILTSCSSAVAPITEVASYSEKTAEVEIPLKVDIDCENATIEVYSWNSKSVKLEMNKTVRGNEDKESLTKKLNDFKIDFSMDGEKLSLKSRFAGGGRTEGFVKLRLYIPKKTEDFSLAQKEGSIVFFDDYKGNMLITADNLDLDINKIEGRLDCKIAKGDVKISSGYLENDSRVALTDGNIRICASFENSGNYDFKTDFGILALSLPENTSAIFDTYGVLEAGEFPSDGNPSRFRLESKMGRINITKF